MENLNHKTNLIEVTKVVNDKPRTRSLDFPTVLFLSKQATSEHHSLTYLSSFSAKINLKSTSMRRANSDCGEKMENGELFSLVGTSIQCLELLR